MSIDVYADESIVRAKLQAWHQWRNSDVGLVGTGRMANFSEDAAARRDQTQNEFRLPIVVSDAQCTDRALTLLRDNSTKQHAALMHYHFKSSCLRSVALAAKIRNIAAAALLTTAHSNFMYYRSV